MIDSQVPKGYQESTCFFCKARIEFHTLVSPTGKGNFDDIGCRVCRVPVCDNCGSSTWEGGDDIGYRIRLCPDCQSRHPTLVPANWDQWPSSPRYCQACRTLKPGEIETCRHCNMLICKACQEVMHGTRFCKVCGEREQSRAFTCPDCRKTVYPFQNKGNDPFRKCRGCGRNLCQSCFPFVGKVQGVIERVCRRCGPSLAIKEEPPPEPMPEPETPATFTGKVKSFFANYLGIRIESPLSADSSGPPTAPSSSPSGQAGRPAAVPFGKDPRFEELKSLVLSANLSSPLPPDHGKLKDSQGNSLLHLAVHFQAVGFVQRLIQEKADGESVNRDGESPLFIAVRQGNEALALVLLEHGADPNRKNKNATTPVHLAAKRGFRAFFQAILTTGYPDFVKDNEGKTPLEIAGGDQGPDYAGFMFEVFLRSLERHPAFLGSALKNESAGRYSSVAGNQKFLHLQDLFRKHQDLFRTFMQQKRFLTFPDRGFVVAKAVVRFLRTGNEVDSTLRAVLPSMAPAFYSRTEEDWWVVEKFLDLGWNPNAQNEAGDTLLHLLIRSHPEGMGRGAVGPLMGRIQQLLKSKADPRIPNRCRETAAQLAAARGVNLDRPE